MATKTGWIAVDLDGVLANYDEGGNNGGKIGAPISAMIDLVKKWVADGQDVRIFTSRAGDVGKLAEVKTWLNNNGLAGLKVTNVKDSGMAYLIDDKAIGVFRNTGKFCASCLERHAGLEAEVGAFSKLPHRHPAHQNCYEDFL